MIAIVLVGGKQSLVSELYPDLPTALIPVAGEPFLYWLTQWLKTQGFTHIVYSAGHYADKITAWAHHMASLEKHLNLDVVTETRPLGTAGAAALCANRFPSDLTFIVNGDSILLRNVRPFMNHLQQNEMLDAIILSTPVANAGRFGSLEMDNENRLIAFKEKQPSQGPVNAGVYILRGQLLADIVSDKEHSLEYHYFPHWLEQNKHIQVIGADAPFIDIGTPETLKRAQDQIMEYQNVITGQKSFL